MAKSFTLDLSKFEKAIRQAPEVVGRGAEKALDEIAMQWQQQAIDLAPVDTGALRRGVFSAEGKVSDGIKGEVKGDKLSDLQVIVTSNATQRSGTTGKTFNYAYYIHEKNAGGKSLRTPGTVKKFLDESADRNLTEWKQLLEDDIADELKKAGW